MQSKIKSIQEGISQYGASVLLASPDTLLILDLERIFGSLGLRVESVIDGGAALTALKALSDSNQPAIVLLDARLTWVANGRLLAAIHEMGVRRRCAIALIADQVSDEWIARLREGVLDDIVPRNADAAMWNTHLSTMRRGHQLYCELEELRAASLMEVRHDRLTGVFNRETMLSLLFRETDRVQRLRGALCVVGFDVDDFGHWNSLLGPDAGDMLLRGVSERTGAMLRSYDLLGRTGGDEFLLALPGCSPINASMLVDRMRIKVFGEPFTVLQGGTGELVHVTLTASFGIASSRGRSPVVVIRELERTLEQARQFGPDAMRYAGEFSGEGVHAGAVQLYPEAGAVN